MNELMETENIKIEDMIYEIRGKQVMLASDLANLYQCKNGTKSINLAVKRNIDKFPEDFCFKLTDEETKNIWFQLETKKIKLETRGGKYNNVYVFTEEGVAMLSSVLKTEIAANVSINIMRAFVKMRKYISNSLINQNNYNDMLIDHEGRIKTLEKTFSKFESKRKVNEIYFNGQIYDSYSKILDILNEAKQELIIIDGYADKTVLDLIKNLNVKIILIVKNKSLITETDINKYNSQYDNLKIIHDDTFHDRYFIIDKDTIYHCGTSLNRIGNKTFSINILEDEIVKQLLIDKVKTLI